MASKFRDCALLQKTEAYDIAGIAKTAIWTELSTGAAPDDRVFLVGGNFDSLEHTKKSLYSKYRTGADGYRVLLADGCKLVLDIDWTGKQSWESIDRTVALNVQIVETQAEFDQCNGTKNAYQNVAVSPESVTIDTLSSGIKNKYAGKTYDEGAALWGNSIIWIPGEFQGSSLPEILNGGLSIDPAEPRPTGFYMRRDDLGLPVWVNINKWVYSNRVYSFGKHKFPIVFTCGKKAHDIPLFGNVFNGSSYVFDEKTKKWTTDIPKQRAFITKQSFRKGKFSAGSHTGGVFGDHLGEKVEWSTGKWRHGVFLGRWTDGDMAESGAFRQDALRAIETSPESVPTIVADKNSDRANIAWRAVFEKGNILGGRFESCSAIGPTYSAGQHYFGVGATAAPQLNFTNVVYRDGLLEKSKTNISTLQTCDVRNSQAFSATFKSASLDGVYGASNNVLGGYCPTILGAEIWPYYTDPSPSGMRGVLKLKVSKEDWEKISPGQGIYLSDLDKSKYSTLLDLDRTTLLRAERRYDLSVYTDPDLSSRPLCVSKKTPSDNATKHGVRRTVGGNLLFGGLQYNLTIEENPAPDYTIDIDCSAFAWAQSRFSQVYFDEWAFGKLSVAQVLDILADRKLETADFRKGTLEKAKWDGANTFVNANMLVSRTSDEIEQTPVGTASIAIGHRNEWGADFSVGDIVWLPETVAVNDATGQTVEYPKIPMLVTGTYSEPNGRHKAILTKARNTGPDFVGIGNRYFPAASADAHRAYLHPAGLLGSNVSSGSLWAVASMATTYSCAKSPVTVSDFDANSAAALRIVNSFFANGGNTINRAHLYKCVFANGSDTVANGWISGSLWRGGNFGGGVFANGYWMGGNFKNGVLYKNKSEISDVWTIRGDYDIAYTDRRKGWHFGKFEKGKVIGSDWFDGHFLNGTFVKSEWYGGTWSNGTLGEQGSPTEQTGMARAISPLDNLAKRTTWENGAVVGAVVGGAGFLTWKNGRFDAGVFDAYGATGHSIWENGKFSQGLFTGVSVWKDGDFFGGKFRSVAGWSGPGPTVSQHHTWAWENGRFWDGEFGNGATGANSTWKNGVFLGGVFKGRLWADGTFKAGRFEGDAWDDTMYGSYQSAQFEQSAAEKPASGYYRGLWLNGTVLDTAVENDEKALSSPIDKDPSKNKTVLFDGAYWLSGTVSHDRASLERTLFFDGEFIRGSFDSGIFNPFTDRTFSGAAPMFSDAVTWSGGRLRSTHGTATVWRTVWKSGTVEDGVLAGVVWNSGTMLYGNANNVYWKDGRWRNGNWNGSPFGASALSSWSASVPMRVIDERALECLSFVAAASGDPRLHMTNAFSASLVPNKLLVDEQVRFLNNSDASWYAPLSDTYRGVVAWTNGQLTTTDPAQAQGNNFVPVYGDLQCSVWQIQQTYALDAQTVASDSHAASLGGVAELKKQSPAFVLGYNTTNGSYSVTAPSSKIKAMNAALSTHIFTNPQSTYEIKLRLAVELEETVPVKFGVGGVEPFAFTFSSTKSAYVLGGERYLDYYPKAYDVSFVYNTTQALIGATDSNGYVIGDEFYMQKTGEGVVRLLSASITERTTEYHPYLNNSLSGTVSAGYAALPFDPHLYPVSSSDTGEVISIAFGNGLFEKGVWETGVWNNGRFAATQSSSDYVVFSDVSPTGTYKLSDDEWNIELVGSQGFVDIAPGDRVSAGNLVAIDVNEKRNPINTALTVKSVDNTNGALSLSLSIPFPMRRIERDSENHFIYVSKRTWLGGAFLNGYFRGVFNGGLVKGLPMTTLLEDTQMTNGKFDGGHFVASKVPVAPGNLQTVSTGLVQNMQFLDNNVAQPNEHKYLSWMDLNWEPKSKTNINKDSTYLVQSNSGQATASYFRHESNLYGMPTKDVLFSLSRFRDKDSASAKEYALGWKAKKYYEYMPDEGLYTKPFSSEISFVGMQNYIDNGWSDSVFYGDLSLESNTSQANSRKFSIRGTSSNIGHWIRLENNNVPANTQTGRYYLVEALMRYTGTPNVYGNVSNALFGTSSFGYLAFGPIELANYPFTAGQFANPDAADYSFNHLEHDDPLKTEWFYNKNELELTYLDINRVPDISIDRLSFYEVDMVPFFRYATAGQIDMSIRTPYRAVAPRIDYSRSDFDFIGNVALTIDSAGVVQQQAFVNARQQQTATASGVGVTADPVDPAGWDDYAAEFAL